MENQISDLASLKKGQNQQQWSKKQRKRWGFSQVSLAKPRYFPWRLGGLA